MSQTSRLVELSACLYRLLLAAYPAAFRSEYGEAMVQLFRDTASEAYRRRGSLGLAAMWLRMLTDFTFSVFREHRDKPMNQSSESVLLREFVQQWRQFGSVACSVAVFSAWYLLHHFGAILTVIAFGTWFASFFDSVHLMRGSNKDTQVAIVVGLVDIWHHYEWGQAIPEEQYWREVEARQNNNPARTIEINDRLRAYPWPWQFSFISDIGRGRGIRELIQPGKCWRLRFHFGFFPVLLLGWTIHVYRRRNAGSIAAVQSA